MPRITIDLTDSAAAEIDRLVESSELSGLEDAFRTGLSLLRIHMEAAQKGHVITIVKGSQCHRIILPFEVAQ